MNKRVYLNLIFTFLLFNSSFSQNNNSAFSFTGNRDYIKVPSVDSLPVINSSKLTFEFWMRTTAPAESNKFQTVYSKKAYASLEDFKNTTNWDVFDATNESGLSDQKGFVGASFDGRYVYFSPWWKGGTQSGTILRYDTHEDYSKTESWDTYNAENEDGHVDIRGLEGNIFDGRYVYFVPLHHDGIFFGKILRYDTHKDFSDAGSWDVYNAENADGMNGVKGFTGAVFDGHFIYFVPNSFSPHGKILRYNTQSNFADSTSWDLFNLCSKPEASDIAGFFGGVFDGQYVYFIPFASNGKILRYDTKKEYKDTTSWEVFNTSLAYPDGSINSFTGAIFDGTYVYFSPYSSGKMLRYNTRLDFLNPASWENMNVRNTDGNDGILGGVGPIFDGRFIYFPPMAGTEGRSGKFLIYDTYFGFNNPDSWTFFDWQEKDSQLRGFEGGVFDGQYIYFCPMNFEDSHGKILRYNTLPETKFGYSFCYTKNSSSFGTVNQTPTFYLNTTKGVRAVSLKEISIVSDNAWHHLATTYDGNIMKIYVDGKLNNSSFYSSGANGVINHVDMGIGAEPSSANGIKGDIDEFRIWTKTFSEAQINETMYSCISGNEESLARYFPFNKTTDTTTLEKHFNLPGYLKNYPTSISVELPTLPLQLVAPFGNSTCNTTPLQLGWKSYPGANAYTIQIATDSQFTNIVVDTVQHKDTSFVAPQLNYLTDYYWKINISGSGCTKNWSEARKFQIVESPVISTPYLSVCTNSASISIDSLASPYGGTWSGNGIDNGNTFIPSVNLIGDQLLIYSIAKNGCETYDTMTIAVHEIPKQPQVLINGAMQFCQGDSVQFTAPPEFKNYSWSTGEISSSIRVVTSGNYSVITTDSNNCSSPPSAQLITTAYLTPAQPTVLVKGKQAFCLGDSVSLSAPTGFKSYSWSTGESSSSIKTFSSGNYSVITIDSNNCSSPPSAGLNTTAYLNPSQPTVLVTGKPAFCLGDSVSLSAPTGFKSYSWSTGESSSSIKIFSSGNYSVITTDSNNCSSPPSAQLTTNAYLNPPQPMVLVTGKPAFCLGDSVSLSAPTGFKSYSWSTGESAASIKVFSSGNYSVITTDNSNCISPPSENLITTVYLNPLQPPVFVTGNLQFCQGKGAILSTLTGFKNYSWSTGETSPSINVSTAGIFSVIATDSNNCSSPPSESFTTTVYLNPLQPPVLVTGNLQFCQGNSAILSTPAGFKSYSWSTGETSSSIKTFSSGNYSVITIDSNNCSSPPSALLSTTAYPNPSQPMVLVTGNPAFCIGDSVSLSAPTGFKSYSWSTGESTASIKVFSSGNYSVITTDNNNCSSLPSDLLSTTAFLNPSQPMVLVTGKPAFCMGDSVALSAPTGFKNYSWSTGETSSSIKTFSSGNYSVITTDSNNCSSPPSDLLSTTAYSKPDKPIIYQEGSYTLTTTKENAKYEWRMNGSGIPSEFWYLSAQRSGEYTVRVQNQYGCYSTFSDTYSFFVKALTTMDIAIYPNPNDGHFALELKNVRNIPLKIWITDLLGKIVFATTFTSFEDVLHTEMQLEDATSGIYTLSIQADQQIFLQKIVLAK